MNVPHKPIWIAAAVIGLGASVVFFTRSNAPVETVTPPPHVGVDEAGADPLVADTAAPQVHDSAGPLPWQNSAEPEVPAAASAERQVKQALPEPVSAALPSPAQLQNQLLQNRKAMDEALQQLNEMEASGKVPPQIDVRAMRTNLGVASRAQQLAGEMVILAQQPTDEARTRRIEAIVAELRTLQGQVRNDVKGPVPGAEH